MKATFAFMLAGLVFASANLLAQDAQMVADNLAYSREFYAGVHFQAIAAQPSSFAYDRYPDNGAERIRCNVGNCPERSATPQSVRGSNLEATGTLTTRGEAWLG